jgi:hypothetical protein
VLPRAADLGRQQPDQQRHNLTSARSQIEDADYSAETTALAKAQILAQASTGDALAGQPEPAERPDAATLSTTEYLNTDQ